MYHLSWSVKYSVGDCLLNDETVYLYDSSGPLLKGSYGLKLLLPKNQRSQYGVAFSRDNVESEEFQKVECPKDKLTSEDIEHIRNILNSN
jgi:hypothetical protein